MTTYCRIVSSPIGNLQIRASEVGICGLKIFGNEDAAIHRRIIAAMPSAPTAQRIHLNDAENWLSVYFAASLCAPFVPVAPLTPSKADDDLPSVSKQEIHPQLLSLPRMPNLDLRGSDFRCKVWRHLATISIGETLFYTELADAVGIPGAARAVGSAMATNPVPILVPCHRVLPKGGGIGMYSAQGGVATKEWLLNHESLIIGQ